MGEAKGAIFCRTAGENVLAGKQRGCKIVQTNSPHPPNRRRVKLSGGHNSFFGTGTWILSTDTDDEGLYSGKIEKRISNISIRRVKR
jgi:hypothetical protein